MDKKWYNYFVSVDEATEGIAEEQPAVRPGSATRPVPRSAAQTVAEIAASVAPEPKLTAPVRNPRSFEEIYQAAEIQPPAHGYTILKIAEMLQSEHIRGLQPSVKRSSVLVALEAAGVKLQEIIQDAVRRDRALDTYERVQQKALEELETRKTQENRQIQAEIERLVSQHQARIQANNDEVAKEKERFYGWRLHKRREEEKIAEAVSYFVSENPVTTSSGAAAPPAAEKSQKATPES